MRLILIVFVFVAVDIVWMKSIVLNKCCRRANFFSEEFECVRRHDYKKINHTEIFIQPPMNSQEAYWIPQQLRNESIEINYIEQWDGTDYNVHPANDSVVNQWLNIIFPTDIFETASLNDDSYAVRNQSVCFEAVDNSNESIVALTWTRTVTVKKCCGRGEQLDLDKHICVINTNETHEIIDEELLEGENNTWLPSRLHSIPVKMLYDQGSKGKWNVLINADNYTAWHYRSSVSENKIWVQTDSGSLRGVTQRYCFDETVNKQPYSRVLIALVTNITKCCHKNEEFRMKDNKCVRTKPSVPALDFEVIKLSSDSSIHWIPQRLRSSQEISVRYDNEWLRSHHTMIVPADGHSQWKIEFPDDNEPQLLMTMTDNLGNIDVWRTEDFCFDFLIDRPQISPILMANFDKRAKIIPKCCHIGKRLGPDGYCEENPDKDWSPESLSPYGNVDDIYVPRPSPFSSCSESRYKIEELKSPYLAWSNNLTLTFELNCFDIQRTSEGIKETVSGTCVLVKSYSIYAMVRPLYAVTTILLAVAVIAILCRPEMRRTTHGMALINHAVSLMVANGLRVLWIFTSADPWTCDNSKYAIYFFLIAAACWLNAVSVNMAWDFQKPLGAMSRKSGGGWKRVVMLAVWAYGVPTVLMSLTIYMDIDWLDKLERGYIVPTFLETRTCGFELYFDRSSYRVPRTNFLGSLLYYFVPTAILVTINIVCLILTIRKIGERRMDSSVLQSTSKPLQSTVLYVKLLLSAGVLELVLEIASWGYLTRGYPDDVTDASIHAMEVTFIFATAGILFDLVRAVAILWLCVGHWSGLVKMWRSMMSRLCSTTIS